MKVEVQNCKKEIKLPNVGDVWQHSGFKNEVYMRIDDQDGKRVVNQLNRDGLFCSISLDSARVVHTPKDVIDIIILTPKDGVMAFVPENC